MLHTSYHIVDSLDLYSYISANTFSMNHFIFCDQLILALTSIYYLFINKRLSLLKIVRVLMRKSSKEKEK